LVLIKSIALEFDGEIERLELFDGDDKVELESEGEAGDGVQLE